MAPDLGGFGPHTPHFFGFYTTHTTLLYSTLLIHFIILIYSVGYSVVYSLIDILQFHILQLMATLHWARQGLTDQQGNRLT